MEQVLHKIVEILLRKIIMHVLIVTEKLINIHHTELWPWLAFHFGALNVKKKNSLLHTLASSHPHTSTTTYINSSYLHKNFKFHNTFVNHCNSFFGVITVQHTFLGYIHLIYKRNDGDVRNTMPQLIWLF